MQVPVSCVDDFSAQTQQSRTLPTNSSVMTMITALSSAVTRCSENAAVEEIRLPIAERERHDAEDNRSATLRFPRQPYRAGPPPGLRYRLRRRRIGHVVRRHDLHAVLIEHVLPVCRATG